MLSDQPPARTAAYQRAQQRFRRVTGLLAVLAFLAVFLQYTPYALLPERKTVVLWGVLVGVVGMGIVGDRQLRVPAQRERAD